MDSDVVPQAPSVPHARTARVLRHDVVDNLALKMPSDNVTDRS